MAIYKEEFEDKPVTKKLLMAPKAFVKGGTFDITKKTIEPSGSGTLYIPQNERIEQLILKQEV